MTDEMFNQYSEVAVLSIILKNSTMLSKAGELKPHMFSSTPNITLYKEILTLANTGNTIEYNLVISYLQHNGMLAQCGGESYLSYLNNQNYNEDNFAEYVSHIIDSFKVRSLLTMANEIPRMVGSGSKIDEVLAWTEGTISSLGMSGYGDTVVDFESAIKSAWDDIVTSVNAPNKVYTTTGFNKLDSVTGGYCPGDLWIVASRPSMGKSSFMCNSALSGVPTLIFSLEMPTKSLIYRLIAIKSGIPVFNIRLGDLTQKQLDLVAETLKEIKGLPIYIDSSYFSNNEYVTSTIKKYHKQYGIRLVHIDYIQIMAERGADSTHELGAISRNLKLLSKDLDITSVIYSQLNRGVEFREDKRPILSDLRQSGNLEEDADVAVFLYRDVVYNKDTKDKDALELLIRKQRNGPIGTVMHKFDEMTNRMYA